MDSTNVARADLLALHRRPADVGALLPPDVATRVQVTDAEPADLGAEPDGPVRFASTGERVVTFPIDGPVGAVELAVAGLFRAERGSIVAPSTPGGIPTGWWVLDLLAAYAMPAVDLRGVRWVDGGGIWWTQPSGPVRLPLPVRGARNSCAAASVLLVAEALPPSDPVTVWLEGTSDPAVEASEREWRTLLCARYLTMTAGHLLHRSAVA